MFKPIFSLAPLAVALGLTLTSAGCGSSSSPSSGAVVPVAAAPSTPPSDTTAARTNTTPRTTSTSTTTTTTTTTAAPTTTAAATTTSTQTTPATGGSTSLAPATGYASYDDCTGVCTGAVPAALQRPLALPSVPAGGACPVSATGSLTGYPDAVLGPGPVYAGQSSPLSVTSFIGSSWSGARVNWVASAAYSGPLLIRGGEVGGSGQVGFGEGQAPENELQLLTAVQTESGNREWPSFTRVLSPGCYAYQVDGTSFSEVIVFQVTG